MNTAHAVAAGGPRQDAALFVENVTQIDCGLLHPERGLVGATWLVDAKLQGTLDDQGMLVDFGAAKRMLKDEIDARFDHRLLVPGHAPELTSTGDTLAFTTRAGERIEYRGPEAAVAMLDAREITTALLETRLAAALSDALPANVAGLTLQLRAEAIAGPAYNYCHGLKAHNGACQHLGHGHRGRLQITVDGNDSPRHAAAWAERWQDVFIGQRADMTTAESDARYRFAYRSRRGEFALTLDAGRCVLLDGPATVENIAAYIADTLAHREPGREFAVRACEGVGKGAVATRRADVPQTD